VLLRAYQIKRMCVCVDLGFCRSEAKRGGGHPHSHPHWHPPHQAVLTHVGVGAIAPLHTGSRQRAAAEAAAGSAALPVGGQRHYEFRAPPAKAAMELRFALNYPVSTSELLLFPRRLAAAS
jgi:hypothetical protein